MLRGLCWLSCLALGAAFPGQPFRYNGDAVGWVNEFGFLQAGGGGENMTFRSDARAFVVENPYVNDWWSSTFLPFHLRGQTISFTVDLSNVGCGCIACLYFVPMKKAGPGSNYCDGQQGGCIEIDIMEANMMAFHTSLHTEWGSAFDGSCNGNGCAANFGRYPYTNSGLRTKDLYGPEAAIDSKRPFQVSASWDMRGDMTIHLSQGNTTVPIFNRTSAGNIPTMKDGGYPDPQNYSQYPKPGGVPDEATQKAARHMDEGLRLVASLWDGGDTFWLDHSACDGEHWCSLSSASFSISDLKMTPAAAVAPMEVVVEEAERLFASAAVPASGAAGYSAALAALSMMVVCGVLVRRQRVRAANCRAGHLAMQPLDAFLE